MKINFRNDNFIVGFDNINLGSQTNLRNFREFSSQMSDETQDIGPIYVYETGTIWTWFDPGQEYLNENTNNGVIPPKRFYEYFRYRSSSTNYHGIVDISPSGKTVKISDPISSANGYRLTISGLSPSLTAFPRIYSDTQEKGLLVVYRDTNNITDNFALTGISSIGTETGTQQLIETTIGNFVRLRENNEIFLEGVEAEQNKFVIENEARRLRFRETNGVIEMRSDKTTLYKPLNFDLPIVSSWTEGLFTGGGSVSTIGNFLEITTTTSGQRSLRTAIKVNIPFHATKLKVTWRSLTNNASGTSYLGISIDLDSTPSNFVSSVSINNAFSLRTDQVDVSNITGEYYIYMILSRSASGTSVLEAQEIWFEE